MRGRVPPGRGSGWLLDAAKTISMTPRMPLVIYLIAYLLIANVLWFYNDRYLIVLLPVVVAWPRRAPTRWRGATPGVDRDCHLCHGCCRNSGRSCVSTKACVTTGRRSWTVAFDRRTSTPGVRVEWMVALRSPREPVRGTDRPGRAMDHIAAASHLHSFHGRTRQYDVAREVAWTDDAPWPGPDRLLVLKRRAPH